MRYDFVPLLTWASALAFSLAVWVGVGMAVGAVLGAAFNGFMTLAGWVVARSW